MKSTRQIALYLFLPAFLFCNIAIAQIQVEQEPHHKVVFRNDYVRILDLSIMPGDSTLMHIHSAQSAVLWMSNSTFEIRNAGESAVMTKVKAGDVVFRAYGEKPATHVVLNSDTAIFHCMVVEMIKPAQDKDTCPILSATGIKLQWQKGHLSAYKAVINRDQRYNLPESGCARILIVVSGTVTTASSGNAQSLNAGGFAFFPPYRNIRINGKEDAAYVLLELQ
jgi:uncharacterized cupin superfamily protein